MPKEVLVRTQSILILGRIIGKEHFFQAFVTPYSNRLFRLRLVHSGDTIFSNDVSFENTAGSIGFKTDRIYSGTMEGKDKRTRVISHPQIQPVRNVYRFLQ